MSDVFLLTHSDKMLLLSADNKPSNLTIATVNKHRNKIIHYKIRAKSNKCELDFIYLCSNDKVNFSHFSVKNENKLHPMKNSLNSN